MLSVVVDFVKFGEDVCCIHLVNIIQPPSKLGLFHQGSAGARLSSARPSSAWLSSPCRKQAYQALRPGPPRCQGVDEEQEKGKSATMKAGVKRIYHSAGLAIFAKAWREWHAPMSDGSRTLASLRSFRRPTCSKDQEAEPRTPSLLGNAAGHSSRRALERRAEHHGPEAMACHNGRTGR